MPESYSRDPIRASRRVAHSFALAALLVGAASVLSAEAAFAQVLVSPPYTKTNPKDAFLNVGGNVYKLISGTTKVSAIEKLMNRDATLVISNPDGSKSFIWTTSDVAQDFTAGAELKSFVFTVDNQDTFISEVIRDDSGNTQVRTARNKELAAVHAKSASNAQKASLAAENAETAILVLTGNTDCHWPVSASNLAKARAMVKDFRQYTNQIDYDGIIAAQGGAGGVGHTEFCFGPKWRGIFDNALKALAATPSP